MSSGIGGRLALYAAYSSCRKVGPGASKHMAAYPGRRSSMSLISMRVKPKTALVGRPWELANPWMA